MLSSKTEKVAESPFEIDLQLFAEDEPSGEPTCEPSGEPSEPTLEPNEPDNKAVTPEPADPEPDKPVQDHETNKAFQQMRKQIQDTENFARSLGYSSFAELQQAQQQQAYIEQGYDPVSAQLQAQQDMLQNQLFDITNESRVTKEKSLLQGQKYFKELEPEIDTMLNADPRLNVEDCFNFLKGVKIDELVSKESKAAQQRTLNNMNSKSHIKPDGKSADNDFIDVDPEEFKMAKALNPKETLESYRAWKKSNR